MMSKVLLNKLNFSSSLIEILISAIIIFTLFYNWKVSIIIDNSDNSDNREIAITMITVDKSCSAFESESARKDAVDKFLLQIVYEPSQRERHQFEIQILSLFFEQSPV